MAKEMDWRANAQGWLGDLPQRPEGIRREMGAMGVRATPGRESPLGKYLARVLGRPCEVRGGRLRVYDSTGGTLAWADLPEGCLLFEAEFQAGNYPELVQCGSAASRRPAVLRTVWGQALKISPVNVTGVLWATAESGAGIVVTHTYAKENLSDTGRLWGRPGVPGFLAYDGEGRWAIVAYEDVHNRERIMAPVTGRRGGMDPARFLRAVLNAECWAYLKQVGSADLQPLDTVVGASGCGKGLVAVKCAGGRVALATLSSYLPHTRRLAGGGKEVLLSDLEVVEEVEPRHPDAVG